jgi:signal transduction histidine kinase
LLAREREATADLSHRLRTPLTALRIDAETLSSTTERTRITAHLDALERTVDEIIRTARRGAQAGVATRCDATVVVAERVAFWTALADEERRTVTLAVHAGPIPVRVSADDLAACLDALLDNVFAHTPDGSGFAVRLAHRAGGGARLTVTDEGPGLSSVRPDRGASGAGSTGLGLDIVRRIAAESGGQVILNVERPAGAEITVELGPPAY